VVPHPYTDIDFLRTSLADSLNQIRWAQDADLTAWLGGARLNLFRPATGTSLEASPALQEALGRFAQNLMPGIENLRRLLAQVETEADPAAM